MILASIWPWYIHIPALIVGIAIFAILILYALARIDLWSVSIRKIVADFFWVLLGFCAVMAYLEAWDFRNVLREFLLFFATNLFMYGSAYCGIFSAVLLGTYRRRMTKNDNMNLLYAAICGFAVYVAIVLVAVHIPVIDSRMEYIFHNGGSS